VIHGSGRHRDGERDVDEGAAPLGVERTFSWFRRNQRRAEGLSEPRGTLATFVTLAFIQLALRRLARE
jgi:hypothetical protein